MQQELLLKKEYDFNIIYLKRKFKAEVLYLYLKRLDIQGFKSFADKISLEFNSGITSVVGPNGSGKSNIADAIRWVLGEQSVKTLRGSRMEDVIFAGTEHRKPLGFAEVSLTIDNSDNRIPVEYNELTISRRIFRSGESEYFINKTSCRLKDINELFFDTGMGKDGYSIIGQGKVDEILSTRSEDRRSIFEEASGIMKYKIRKLDAERKLELTKQNLLRIYDILIELENQLEPLRQQSETAKKFLNLRESIKELEINIYIDNISKFKEKIKDYEEQYNLIRESIDTENTRINDITRENREKTELVKILDERLNTARQLYFSLEGNIERCNSELKLNNEKMNNLSQNIIRIDNEIAEVEVKIQNLSTEDGSKQEKLKYLNKRYADYSTKLVEYEKELDSVLSSLGEKERHIENLKTNIMDKLDIQSDKKTQINYLNTHIEALEKRQRSIDEERFQIAIDNDRSNIKKEDIVENLHVTNERISQSKSMLEGMNKKKNEFDMHLSEQKKRQNTVKAEIQFKNSRHKMLCEMERNMEGYNRSVKMILQQCKQSLTFGEGIHGALAQLISVERKYETAVEMALGNALQNIVTTNEDDAKKAIEYLKKDKLGRATFLPICSVKGRQFEGEILNKVRNHEGFCGIASDLVECNPDYNGIILSLLGKVAIVENLGAAIKMAKHFGYNFRIVTLEGDMLNTSGSMSGGSMESKGISILSRNREILELKDEIERLQKEDKLLDMESNETITNINGIAKDVTLKEEEIRNDELVKMRDEQNLLQIEENARKWAAKIDMLKQEKNQLSRQVEETKVESSKYISELNQVENEIAETKKIISEYQEKHKEDQSVRDALHRDITDYKISVNSILESIEAIKETMDKIMMEKESLNKSILRRQNEKVKNNDEISSLKERDEGIKKMIKNHEDERAGKTFEVDRITEERKVLEEELSDILNQISETNKSIMLHKEEFTRVEVKKAKIESEMEMLQNRMWDEYELTYTNALSLKKEIGSIVQAQKKANEIRNQIKELGPINISSIEEYIKTKERFEFMSNQKDDMEQAREKLHRIIYEMTSIMRKQFIEQFKMINENFNIVFKELFDGGRAELRLVDEENVLESGIDIEAQPPGKKLQNLLLLSGGERALTAIALLFAILRLRPSPFCILDEIEAALDDANVYRFSRYLGKYSKETQFIMVTHRKGTMEGSDMLYGVTMQERGISKIVSMKIDENKAV